MKKIIILGCTGGCLDLLDLIHDSNESLEIKFNFLGFLDDNHVGKEVCSYKVLGKFEDWKRFEGVYFATAIGSEKNFFKRSEIINKLGIPKDRFLNLIHPSAKISKYASISNFGVVIHSNSIIKTNCKIDEFALLLSSVIVNHDSSISSYSIINSNVNISGGVNIGESSYLGAGCICLPNINIEDRVLIGAGSVVTKDCDSLSLYRGIPAKKIKGLISEK